MSSRVLFLVLIGREPRRIDVVAAAPAEARGSESS